MRASTSRTDLERRPAITRAFAIGVDFGSTSARAVVVSLAGGEVIGEHTSLYPSGTAGVLLDPADPFVARQSPGDFLHSLEISVTGALDQARGVAGFHPGHVIALGIDTTGSTPIPLDGSGRPLAESHSSLAAQAWMWKDHTAHAEAEEISRVMPAEWMKRISVYSSEWYWAKLLKLCRTASDVAAQIGDWIELCDWIPAELTGHFRDPARSLCAAGHKALYAPSLGGLPPRHLFASLHPVLAEQYDRLAGAQFYSTGCPAGMLNEAWAKRLGLSPNVVVAAGAFDAHLGAIGAGVGDGVLVKVIGTSCCDIAVGPVDPMPSIEGVCGVVESSVIEGRSGIEAGQSAVGDLFAWWQKITGQSHAEQTALATELKPGESGLIALDWNNGNRSLLVDQRLTGLILGQTLSTTPAEIYRALIEATAFGARQIVERIEERGVPLDRIVMCGGVAEKNQMLLQIYADVLDRTIQVAGSDQACALGSAIAGAVAAKAFPDVPAAQTAMVPPVKASVKPVRANVQVYNDLFDIYRQLHDAFGGASKPADLSGVMKRLLEIRETAAAGRHVDGV